MKQYPKIQYHNKGLFGEYCYSFDKIDGSNIRLEWGKKRGWYKFGTKGNMIDQSSDQFGESIGIFLNKYSNDLEKIFRDKKEYRNSESFVVFCEFFGESSFAGQHNTEDKKDMILFDISQYKRGFIPPKEFIENFGHLHIPKVIYQGEYNHDLISSVKENQFSLKEGLVVKGTFKTKGSDQIWMVKIKTNEWINKVKSLYGEDALLEEVNFDKSLVI